MKTIIEKLGITPGPWRVTGAFKHIIATGEESTNQVVGEIWPNRKYTLNMNKRYNLSDADLIAAAPEMLEALIACKTHITGMIKGCEEDMRDGVDEAGIIAEALQQLYESINFNSIEKACYPKSWEEIKELL